MSHNILSYIISDTRTDNWIIIGTYLKLVLSVYQNISKISYQYITIYYVICVTLYHLCNIMSHVILRHIRHYAYMYYVILHHIMSHVILCHIMSYYITLCHMSYYVTLCHTM